MIEQPQPAGKRRRQLNAIGTVLAVVLLVAVAHGPGAVVVAAVALAAVASALASPSVAAAVANVVVGAGVFGAIALTLANGGIPTDGARVWFFIAVAIPAAALLVSATSAARKIVREPGLEFEAHVLVRAAAVAFVVTFAVAATLTAIDAVSTLRSPPPVVYLVAGITGFVLALNAERRRMA